MYFKKISALVPYRHCEERIDVAISRLMLFPKDCFALPAPAIAVLALFFYAGCILYAQSGTGAAELSPFNTDNIFETGVHKITNTYIFTGSADYNFFSTLGSFHLKQRYTGTALRTSQTSFRDDEDFSFLYAYPLSGGISLTALQNWQLSNDTKSIGINKLERLNGCLGIRYDFLHNSYFAMKAGLERNNQIGIETGGWLAGADGALKSYKFDNFTLDADTEGEYLRLDDGRINAGFSANAGISGVYDTEASSSAENSMNFLAGYKLFNRDYLSTLYKTEDNFPVERRLEKRLNISAGFDYSITEKLSSRLGLSMSSVDVSRSYKNPVDNVSLTRVYRNLNEFQLNFTGELFYISKMINLTGGANFFSRNEENSVQNKFNIKPEEYASLKSLDNQRDNSTSKTRLYARGLWAPTRKDSISFDYSVSLLQYDTPSNLNNDDRDEFSTIAGINYGRKISPLLSAGLSSEIQMTHLVFLKAAKSAMNNWNRIIRLAPYVHIESARFLFAPVFEVLANYTAYDFEEKSPSVESFSYRQLGYRDTLCFRLHKSLSIQTRTIIKYFERGTLYWNSFDESPQTGSFEQFSKALFVTQKGNITAGCGARIYYMTQRNISENLIKLSPGNDFTQIYVGPELVFKAYFDSGTVLSVNGWYEFQYFNEVKKDEIPNIFLNVKWIL